MKVELTCFLYNKKMVDDLGIDMGDIEAKAFIETDDISWIRERGSDTENEVCKNTCMVIFKSGDSVMVKKNYHDMINIWANSAVV